MQNKPQKGDFLVQANGKPWLTETNKKVPAVCQKCGLPMKIKLRGEPVFICDNNHYFGTVKFQGE